MIRQLSAQDDGALSVAGKCCDGVSRSLPKVYFDKGQSVREIKMTRADAFAKDMCDALGKKCGLDWRPDKPMEGDRECVDVITC